MRCHLVCDHKSVKLKEFLGPDIFNGDDFHAFRVVITPFGICRSTFPHSKPISKLQNCFAAKNFLGETVVMNLRDAIVLVKEYSERMNALYGSVVFDEWAIVSFSEKKGRVLSYSGTRKEGFQANFSTDIEALKAELLSTKHETGDFDFARHASGTHFDAFMVLGEEIYLLCNNTTQSIHGITKDPRWLGAQVPFAELTEKFRADPLVEN